MNNERTPVLVTGGAGYIGSHTCKALYAAGFEPVTYDNLSTGHRWAVKWGPLVEASLDDSGRIAEALRTHGVQAVVHFAASAYVGESMRAPAKYFANNVTGSLNLLDAMKRENVPRLVFSSTCATYGLPREVPIGETHPQHPINPYGESKLFVERAIHWYTLIHDLRAVVLRYFNAAGADPAGELGEVHDPETHLVPLAIEAALGRGPALSIFGTDYPTADGTAVRDYVHVSDLAVAHVRAVERLLADEPGGTFNLGTGAGHSVREVIAAVAAIGGVPVPLVEAQRRDGDPPVLVADPSLARAELDWSPALSGMDSIVETALRWHRRMRPDRLDAGDAA
ncbi:MAG: UDP-glucose 4-epimerase GalE [Gammaproteobacteria bacterium]